MFVKNHLKKALWACGVVYPISQPTIQNKTNKNIFIYFRALLVTFLKFIVSK